MALRHIIELGGEGRTFYEGDLLRVEMGREKYEGSLDWSSKQDALVVAGIALHRYLEVGWKVTLLRRSRWLPEEPKSCGCCCQHCPGRTL